MTEQINKLKSSGTVGRFKLLIKDSVVFGGLSAFTKFFSLFLTPILTSILTKEQYGNIDILNPIMSIAATVIIFGMDSGTARFYYKTDDESERRQIVSNGFWVQTFISAITCSTLFFLKRELLIWYLGNSYHPIQEVYVNIIICVIIFTTPIRFAQNLLLWIFKKRQYVFLTAGYIIFNFTGTVLAIYLCKDKVLAVFLGQVAPAFIFAVVALVYIKKYIVFRIDLGLLIPMLKYGVPYLIVAFIPAIIPSLDRFTINKFLGLSAVASYGIGYRVASLIAIPIMSINTAIGPFILALHKERSADKLFNLIAYCIIIFISIFIMFTVILAPFIITTFATKAYMSGLIVIVPLSFYFLIEMLRSISAVGIDLSMKTYWNLILYPVAILFLYFLINLLTPRYGIIGTANALAFSSLLNFVMFTFVGTRLYPFKYNISKKMLMLIIGYIFSTAVLYCVYNNYNVISICITFGFIILSLYLFLSKQDRKQMYMLIKKKLA